MTSRLTDSPYAAAEYAALRATIRERGTLRLALVPVIFIGWAGIAVATAAVITVALSTLVPLLVLAAGFEGVAALQHSVDRIGRYLAVFREPPGPGEPLSAVVAEEVSGTAPDALFAQLFVLAASINFVPAALGGTAVEIGVVAAGHLLFIYRVRTAPRRAARERRDERQRLQELRAALHSPPAPEEREP